MPKEKGKGMFKPSGADELQGLLLIPLPKAPEGIDCPLSKERANAFTADAEVIPDKPLYWKFTVSTFKVSVGANRLFRFIEPWPVVGVKLCATTNASGVVPSLL